MNFTKYRSLFTQYIEVSDNIPNEFRNALYAEIRGLGS